jgi:benzoate/toluate 1,2-dioxygenase subunit alpha
MRIGDLILRDRVHRSVYTDPAIFKIEMEKIFSRAWIYLGHESQIKQTCGYFTTHLGDASVIVVRQAQGDIRVLYNRCAHKGMQLVADDSQGAAKAFRCGYHGWIFDLDGSVKTMPAEAGYDGTAVCKSNPLNSLKPVAGVAVYRGFIFATAATDAPYFHTWLGPLKSSLDNFVDRAPDGEVEVAGGVLRYEHQCNWKFFLENTLDALHPMVVHKSAIRPAEILNAKRQEAGAEIPFELQMILPFGASYAFFDDMGQRGAPFGHGDLGDQMSIHSGYDGQPDYWEAMVKAYGAERAKQILSISRNNSVLYPSIMFKAPVSLIRVIKPIAIDRTILETWHFRLKGAPDSLFARTIQYSTIVNSSAGMVGPDDHEAYRRLQAGLGSDGGDWVWLARYLNQETADQEGARTTRGTSDFVYRNQFAAWRGYMEAA